MTVLGIDIGTSSIKAGILRDGRITGKLARHRVKPIFDGLRAEIVPSHLLSVLCDAIADLGPKARTVDHIAISVFSPGWVAMNARGEPLTPIITHQDRRSVENAREIERRVGKALHLRIAGNRPFPGGISSTTVGWFMRHAPSLMRRADLVGHLNTFLHRRLTGARVIDFSNASYTGLFSTVTLRGWNNELCDAVGVKESQLPHVCAANEIAGRVTRSAANRFALRQGTPVLVGITDTSSAMLLAGAKPGQLVNVSGSTDALALCTDRPRPREHLLTRALGVGRLWMSVSTLASAGSSFDWLKEQLFSEMSRAEFFRKLPRRAARDSAGVTFEPYLAGDRTSIEQPSASFRGLTLASTRENMLAAVIESLARDSAERLDRLSSANSIRIHRRVVLSGGASGGLGKALHRDWPGRWKFVTENEATLRGLALLTPRAY